MCYAMLFSLLFLPCFKAPQIPVGISKIDHGEVECREELKAMSNVGDSKISTVAGIKSLGVDKVQSLNVQCIGMVYP